MIRNQNLIREVFQKFAETNLCEKHTINYGGCVAFAVMAKKYFPGLNILYFNNGEDENFSLANNGFIDKAAPVTPRHAVLWDGEYIMDAKRIDQFDVYRSAEDHSRDVVYAIPFVYAKNAIDTPSRNKAFDLELMPMIEEEFKKCIVSVSRENGVATWWFSDLSDETVSETREERRGDKIRKIISEFLNML